MGRVVENRQPVRTVSRRGRRRKKKKAGKFILFILMLLCIAAGAALVWSYGRITKEYTLEAGEEINLEELVCYGGKIPELKEGLTQEQMRMPGTYEAKVKLWPFTYKLKVSVQDTIPPEGTAVKVTGNGENVEPEAFVTDIRDNTQVTVSFKQVPDLSKSGVQEVHIILTDLGHNFREIVSSFQNVNLKERLIIEAGESIPAAEQFLAQQPGNITILTDLSSIDTTQVGEHEISVEVDGIAATAILEVQDTIPPVITVQKVDGWIGKAIEPRAFAASIEDATQVQFQYVQEPDWTAAGAGTAQILAVDGGGNQVSLAVEYSLQADTVAPEVAVSTIDITVGENVSYKKAVGYSDNCDSIEELKLEIDNSAVNLNEAGEYTVTYTVTDNAGNSTVKTGVVRVWAEEPVFYDEELVNAKADDVLASILTPEMTQLEKAKAIYNWVHGSIGYISHSEKGDYVRGAYEGLVQRQGDCFVYASTAKVLLTRAGITNMDIVKSQVNPSHYWNLVDVGDGWYHFDATPRKDKTVFFMWTDAQLKEYSESHKNTHIYDASLYPVIN